MPYEYKREPLTQDDANRLANACDTGQKKLVIWTLLDTGLRVSELAKLTKVNPDWQGRRIMIYGKAVPYGSSSKCRVIPLAPRLRPQTEGHFALREKMEKFPRKI